MPVNFLKKLKHALSLSLSRSRTLEKEEKNGKEDKNHSKLKLEPSLKDAPKIELRDGGGERLERLECLDCNACPKTDAKVSKEPHLTDLLNPMTRNLPITTKTTALPPIPDDIVVPQTNDVNTNQEKFFGLFSNKKQSHKEDLKSVQYEMLPTYEINGLYDCKIVRVYDGDTFYAAIIIDGEMYRVKCRLRGIDTPEIPRSHSEAMSQDSIVAFNARDRLIELVTNVDVPSILSDKKKFTNSNGVELPSLTDNDMQKCVDEQNTLVLSNALRLNGTDKYGRCLAELKTENGDDVKDILLHEGLGCVYDI